MLGTRVLGAIVASDAPPEFVAEYFGLSQVEATTGSGAMIAVIAMSVALIVVAVVCHYQTQSAIKLAKEFAEMARDSRSISDGMVKMSDRALRAQESALQDRDAALMEITILERQMTPEQLAKARSVIQELKEQTEIRVG